MRKIHPPQRLRVPQALFFVLALMDSGIYNKDTKGGIFVYISDIRLDGNMKETILYEDPLLNHSYYIVEYDTYFQSEVPWHWHDEIELISIASGEALYKTSRREYYLRAGDAIFLNAGALHMLRPLKPCTVSHAHLFLRTFLSGEAGNTLDTRYVLPVVTQRQVEAVPLYQNDPAAAEMLEYLRQADGLCERPDDFSPWRLRQTLSRIWEWLFTRVQECQQQGDPTVAANDAGIKKILLHIQEHYDEDLRVAELAGLINISERECHRLFRTYMDTSPMAFLQHYRLQRAQSFLAYTDKSVMEIALDTGFKTSSYFGKVFKDAIGMTPMAFRKAYRKSAILAEK